MLLSEVQYFVTGLNFLIYLCFFCKYYSKRLNCFHSMLINEGLNICLTFKFNMLIALIYSIHLFKWLM